MNCITESKLKQMKNNSNLKQKKQVEAEGIAEKRMRIKVCKWDSRGL
jgi:hypothetical protein